MTASNRPDRRELVVVTGASTGMGAASARELARRGFHVLAGVRRDVDADALRSEGIEPCTLDITVESDVAGIADRVARDPQGRPLRALINNAGIAVNAPVETLPMAEWRWAVRGQSVRSHRDDPGPLAGSAAKLGHRREHKFCQREGGDVRVTAHTRVRNSPSRPSVTSRGRGLRGQGRRRTRRGQD